MGQNKKRFVLATNISIKYAFTSLGSSSFFPRPLYQKKCSVRFQLLVFAIHYFPVDGARTNTHRHTGSLVLQLPCCALRRGTYQPTHSLGETQDNWHVFPNGWSRWGRKSIATSDAVPAAASTQQHASKMSGDMSVSSCQGRLSRLAVKVICQGKSMCLDIEKSPTALFDYFFCSSVLHMMSIFQIIYIM